MARRRRIWIIIFGTVIFVPVALVLALSIYWKIEFFPSQIIDLHPISFQARTNTEFFYSVGDELKYADEINPAAKTLMRGKITDFLVSPDNKRIAVVANGQLLLADEGSPTVRQIARVDSIFRERKPIGEEFFRDDGLQWSRDGKYLFLIRDRYYDSKGSQLFSQDGELWRYEIETGNMDRFLKPFQAYTYFFGKDSGIYFSVPTSAGSLQLEYFDGSKVRDISTPDVKEIPMDKLATRGESLFFSFSIFDYERVVLPTKRVRLEEVREGGPQRLLIGTKSYISFKQGEGLKGPHYCSELFRSVFLPGDRYFLLNADYCGNYSGQLLIDTNGGKYMELPKDTRVYVTLNTETYPHYRVTAAGIEALPNPVE